MRGIGVTLAGSVVHGGVMFAAYDGLKLGACLDLNHSVLSELHRVSDSALPGA